MTEDEKQKRADECSIDRFLHEMSEVAEKVFELASIARRWDKSRREAFIRLATPNGKPMNAVVPITAIYAEDIARTFDMYL